MPVNDEWISEQQYQPKAEAESYGMGRKVLVTTDHFGAGISSCGEFYRGPGQGRYCPNPARCRAAAKIVAQQKADPGNDKNMPSSNRMP